VSEAAAAAATASRAAIDIGSFFVPVARRGRDWAHQNRNRPAPMTTATIAKNPAISSQNP
jgi:hypothetical protein